MNRGPIQYQLIKAWWCICVHVNHKLGTKFSDVRINIHPFLKGQTFQNIVCKIMSFCTRFEVLICHILPSSTVATLRLWCSVQRQWVFHYIWRVPKTGLERLCVRGWCVHNDQPPYNLCLISDYASAKTTWGRKWNTELQFISNRIEFSD